MMVNSMMMRTRSMRILLLVLLMLEVDVTIQHARLGLLNQNKIFLAMIYVI